MNQKNVVQLDENNYVVGISIAEESPLEPGIFLIPANCVETELPIIPENIKAKWIHDTNSFEFEPVVTVEHIPTYVELRALEYPIFTEYLDGVVKGDQEQIQAYIDACLEVKAKYPKP